MRLKLHAETAHLGRFIDIHAWQDRGDGGTDVAKSITFEVVEQGAYTEPFMRLTKDQGQELMDKLWSCGLRPTEGSGSAGSLAATEKHLADMRTIAMGALKKSGAIE